MINLLFVTHYTGLGGGETSLLTLVEHLVKHEPQIAPHLLTPTDGQLPERWRALSGTTHTIPFRGASAYFVPSIWARFPITGKIADLIAHEQIAAVHSDYHALPFALTAAQRHNIPLVWTCWGWWFRPRMWQRGFFRQPDHTFASSWAIKDGFLGDPPFMPPDQIDVLPPGVDTARFRPNVDGSAVRADAKIAPDAPLVALIARFQDVKGHDTFQDMARMVADAIPQARFIVAGENVHGKSADDAYKARIIARWQADPVLRERLTYLGFRADAERVIAAADVVVCSSHFESYGMVNIEAMASAKPVVSTRAGGPSETVIDGVTGYLVDAGDASTLADRVIALLNYADLRARMGAAGRAHVVDQFAADVMAARFWDRVRPLITR